MGALEPAENAADRPVKSEAESLAGVDGRKFVLLFFFLLGIAAILFLSFKPEKPLGGPTHFRPSAESEGSEGRK